MAEAPSKQEEEVDPLTLFPPEIQQPVQGLAYLGQLSSDVTFCGHTFGLRTLRPEHKFAISQVLQPYRNTIAEVDVYQRLYVAVALTHVDGDQDFSPPIGPDIEAFAKARLNYISNTKTGWYDPTIAYLWTEYAKLEAEAARGIEALHRLSQRGLATTSQPGPDSLIAQGPSVEETSSDSPSSTPSS